METVVGSWLRSNCLFLAARSNVAPKPYDVFIAPTKVREVGYSRPVIILSVGRNGKYVEVAPVSTKWELYSPSRYDVAFRRDTEGFQASGLREDSYVIGDSSTYEILPVEKLYVYKGRLSGEMLSKFLDETGFSASPIPIQEPVPAAAEPPPAALPEPAAEDPLLRAASWIVGNCRLATAYSFIV
jgi:hypothetical protein